MSGNSKAMGVAYRDQLIQGTPVADDAIAGDVGEYISSYLPPGSATALTTATAKTITSIQLTAGDWDVDGQVDLLPAATTSVTQMNASVSPTTNTLGSDAGASVGFGSSYAAQPTTTINQAAAVPAAEVDVQVLTNRIKVAPADAPLTIYLVASATFTVSTMTAYGGIRARRVR